MHGKLMYAGGVLLNPPMTWPPGSRSQPGCRNPPRSLSVDICRWQKSTRRRFYNLPSLPWPHAFQGSLARDKSSPSSLENSTRPSSGCSNEPSNRPHAKTMAPFSHHFRTSPYALLETSDDGSKEEPNGPSPESQPATPWSTFQVRLLLLLSSALSITIGLAVGYLARQPRYSGPLGTSSDQLVSVRPPTDQSS